uniref:Uncharacterized protein n=1 Tax=Candidatus Methanophagaceae archaeon ANME-1 ERB6 TaxID=2759912 RepID=A0A7G9YVJ7_9EURY|nr:hypothetical protein HGMICNAC_00033 [Methanosarcinales archaeon ANME-1 ERB6]
MTDPNWFYSALAQSAAAIVGLIGALLLTKITETSNTIRNFRAELINQKNELREKSYPLIRKIDELERKLKEISGKIGNETVGTTRYGLTGNYGFFDVEKGETDVEKIKKGLKLTSSGLEKWKYSIKNFDERVDELSGIISSLAKIKEYACFISDDFGKKLEEQLLKENDLNTWNEKFKSFKNKVDDYNKITIPQSYYIILMILAFIVIVGVIIPLGYLSAFSGYSKIVLISLFSFGIFGLIFYFIYQVHWIRSIK